MQGYISRSINPHTLKKKNIFHKTYTNYCTSKDCIRLVSIITFHKNMKSSIHYCNPGEYINLIYNTTIHGNKNILLQVLDIFHSLLCLAQRNVAKPQLIKKSGYWLGYVTVLSGLGKVMPGWSTILRGCQETSPVCHESVGEAFERKGDQENGFAYFLIVFLDCSGWVCWSGHIYHSVSLYHSGVEEELLFGVTKWRQGRILNGK